MIKTLLCLFERQTHLSGGHCEVVRCLVGVVEKQLWRLHTAPYGYLTQSQQVVVDASTKYCLCSIINNSIDVINVIVIIIIIIILLL